jgi:hypothetical protein
MSYFLKFKLRGFLALLFRLLSSIYFWGVIGWTLIILRYSSDLILPRYGG